MASWLVLQYVIILLAIKGLRASAYRDRSLGVLSDLFTEDTPTPLIVVVENANELRAFEDEQGDQFKSVVSTDAKDYINDAIVRENYEDVLYNVLRTNGNFEGTLEEQEAHKRLIANALRNRCQDKYECENKCSQKKPKKDCKKDCKAVYDYLVKCPPPGNEWKNQNQNNNNCNKGGSCRPPPNKGGCCGPPQQDSCGPPKRGKTCPPSWRR